MSLPIIPLPFSGLVAVFGALLLFLVPLLVDSAFDETLAKGTGIFIFGWAMASMGVWRGRLENTGSHKVSDAVPHRDRF